jgi:V/A-type H+-transporting ATPase subunit E
MENKLQELTGRLYEEGLAKGRSEAERLVAEAEANAQRIVADAHAKAAGIEEDARKAAEELKSNAMIELSLAGKQAVAALKENISDMIIARTVSEQVGKVSVDPEFIKQMLLAVASNWNGAASGKVTLSALLPAGWEKKFDAEFEGAVRELLHHGVEVGYSDKVKNGFRIGEKNGGYHISFSEGDFNALLDEYLKEKVAKILYS